MDELGPVLARIEAKHPGWTVGRTESGLAFEAVRKPDDHSLHVIIGASLTELERRLDAADPQPRR
jgi:hypothetical protein